MINSRGNITNVNDAKLQTTPPYNPEQLTRTEWKTTVSAIKNRAGNTKKRSAYQIRSIIPGN